MKMKDRDEQLIVRRMGEEWDVLILMQVGYAKRKNTIIEWVNHN